MTEYKSHISSDLDDYEALAAEHRHATKTLKAMKKRDYTLGFKGQKLTAPARQWLNNRIDDWQAKHDELSTMLNHWKAEQAARIKREKFIKAKQNWEQSQRNKEDNQ